MTSEEINIIKDYIRKHRIEPCSHTNGHGPQIDFLCPFLDTTSDTCKCTIYPVRPVICQIFQCNRTHQEMMQKASELLKGKRTLQMQFFSAFECNVGMTFFPDIYAPKAQDFVIFNQIHPDLYQQYEGQVFQVTRVTKDKKFAHITTENSSDTSTMMVPLQWLTKIS